MQRAEKPLASRKNCLQCGSIFGLRLVEGLLKFYYFCPNHDPAFSKIISNENRVNVTMREISGFEEVA